MGLGATQALYSWTIQRLYKLQLFIVIVLLLLLVIINRMVGNSLARVNEPRLMEGGPGKPGDERRELGVKRKYRSKCVSFTINCPLIFLSRLA